ncbi:MAG: VWA-like domain-containing protein [bacterium]|nr:VWA-like domain-containing protein [bacterium]
MARFRAARMWVARNRPYYARALFACPVDFTGEVDSLAVDGFWRMHANPRFAAAHTVEQVAAVIVHELNHLLRGHHARSLRAGIPEAGLDLWNIAADFEINDDLRDDGLDIPGWLIFPETYGLEPGRLAEQYYRDMLDMAEPVDKHDCQVCGFRLSRPGLQDGDSPEGPGPARREQLRRQAAEDIVAHREAEGDWTVPKGLSHWAIRHLEPQVDWRRLLASELRMGIHRRHGTGDTTWSRPPRRPEVGPVLRPGTARPTADVAVVVDTSGSMQAEDHGRAVAEVRAILRAAVPGEAVTVHSADERAVASQTVTQARQIALAGGGGTDMGRAIVEAAAARPRPAVIIVITDGYTPWPPERPSAVTAAVIAVLTRPYQDHHVPRWITAVEAPAVEAPAPGP